MGYITLNYLCISNYVYKRNVIPFLEKKSKIKKIFERVIYIDCIVLGLPNNITILDDAKHVIMADNPLIDIVQRSPSMTRKSFNKILKIIVSFGGG